MLDGTRHLSRVSELPAEATCITHRCLDYVSAVWRPAGVAHQTPWRSAPVSVQQQSTSRCSTIHTIHCKSCRPNSFAASVHPSPQPIFSIILYTLTRQLDCSFFHPINSSRSCALLLHTSIYPLGTDSPCSHVVRCPRHHQARRQELSLGPRHEPECPRVQRAGGCSFAIFTSKPMHGTNNFRSQLYSTFLAARAHKHPNRVADLLEHHRCDWRRSTPAKGPHQGPA